MNRRLEKKAGARKTACKRLRGSLLSKFPQAQCGLKDLEDALATFLSNEKTAVFLNSICERALRLLDRESIEVQVIKKARALEKPAALAKLDTLKARWAEHDRHFSQDLPSAGGPTLPPVSVPPAANPVAARASSNTPR